ncbi:MAG: hypothetical protein AAF353_05115 [Pseudomonadota bacterium]
MPDYDLAIIGSSPLALVFAISRHRQGQKIVILDENPIGGAWRTAAIAPGIRVEEACHLFEYYRGGYQLISRLSGVQFRKLKNQPRVHLENGKEILYTSRLGIASELAKSVLNFCINYTVEKLNTVLPPSLAVFKNKRRTAQYWSEKARLTFKWRIAGILTFEGIMHPECGVSGFIEKLESTLDEKGIDRIDHRVETLKFCEGVWKLTSASGSSLEATNLAITDSACFRLIELRENVHNLAKPLKTYWHILVKINPTGFHDEFSYIHLPDNPFFHRITNLETRDGEGWPLSLIQIRREPDEINGLELQLSKLLAKTGAMREGTLIAIQQQFSSSHVDVATLNRSENPLAGASNITTIPTAGDIMKSVVLNRHLFCTHD